MNFETVVSAHVDLMPSEDGHLTKTHKGNILQTEPLTINL
jgi:hypothetical protein